MKKLLKKLPIASLVILQFCFLCFFCRCKGTLFLLGIITICILIHFLLTNTNKTFEIRQEEIYELVHDMKTPATAELRMNELFLKESFGKLDETQKEIIMQMKNASSFLLTLINDIITLCREEHNNIKYEFERFDINKVIFSCIEESRYIASEKRCTIVFDYSQEETFVYGAKLEIMRVIINLLTNAVKYSHKDKVITVTSKVENGKCLFNVHNFGDYIAPEDSKNIFKKYKSLNKTGTGLGLYICDLILQKHNCKMLVTSEKENGNTFGFNLNLSEKIPALK